MRIVFIGASHFGLRCLQSVNQIENCSVVGVVTAPKQFRISYRPEGVNNVLHADLAGLCADHSIPVLNLQEGMHDEGLLPQVKLWDPDIFVVCGWYHMVPGSWRAVAPAYGLHASLLPDYSGGAPLVWAIINGEEKTGITLFQLADGVDNGPVVGQEETSIHPDDTIASLYSRIEDLGIDLLLSHIPQLAKGSALHTPQDESHRRVFPQRGPKDGLIDWSQSTGQLFNFVRAQTRPYPGAFTICKGKPLYVWRARPITEWSGENLKPGHVLKHSAENLVVTGNGALQIDEATWYGRELSKPELKGLLDEVVLGGKES